MKSKMSPFPHRRTLVSIAVALAVSPHGAALAAPVGHQVVAGQVTVTRPDVLQTVINQASQGAIVNWQSFSIGATERVDIRQPNASSVLLNRVIGNNPSEIYGRLSANGQVFLVNPNGVLFGRNAQVSVGGLVASTLDIANDDFLSGKFHFAGNSTAAVENRGQLQAAERGTVALLGGRVNNDGTISAQLGTAALVAGEKIALDFQGDGLTKIRVDQGAVAALVANRGMVIADGGQAIMSAGAAQALADTVLNQQGVVRARSLVERDGKIVLDGGAHGVTLNSGTLDASGGAGLKGGSVNVTGHHVGLVGNAAIDASGDVGGGTILVGGGAHGANPLIRHAAGVFAGPQASLRADATGSGDGGTVVLWSDGATRMFGAASARGGAAGGNGGFIETSGKYLDVAGSRIDAAGPRGKGGTWLMDPYDIVIISSTTGPDISGSPNFVSNGPASTLFSGDITSVLNAGTSVSVTTGAGGSGFGDITVADNIIKTAGGDATLTLNAARDISVGGQIVIGSSVGRLNVDFNADADGTGGGAIALRNTSVIATNGGNVRFYGQSDPVGGFATGSAVGNPDGILIDTATIDTTSAAGGGSISLRGRGTLFSVDDGNGGFFHTFGNGIRTSNGSLSSGSGAIALTGIGGQGSSGVAMAGTAFSTTGGAIEIRGRSGAPLIDPFVDYFGDGVYSDDASLTTSGVSGRLAISGESVGGYGLQLAAFIGDSGMSGDITLRALSTAVNFPLPMLELNGSLQTTGTLNLLPGGVSATGALTAADTVAIHIDSTAAPANTFTVSRSSLDSVIQPGLSALVIGSASHTGDIHYSELSSINPAYDITLQNGGAGSLGISLDTGITMPGQLLTLSSGGAVTQAGPIAAGSLLLHGTQAGSSFMLNNAGNTVNLLSVRFDQPRGGNAADGDITFSNAGNLQMRALSGIGFDSATSLRQVIAAANSTVAGDLNVQATGDLTLAQTVTMAANNAIANFSATNDLIASDGLTLGSDASLTLAAGNNLTQAGDVTLGDRGIMALSAGNDLSYLGNLTLGNDSSLTITAGNDLNENGDIIMLGTNAVLALSAGNDLNITGDVSLGSNAGMTLGALRDVRVDGTVSTLGGAAIQRVNAGRNITLASGAGFSSAAGPLHLNLNADADNLNGGAIAMQTGSAISTSGGNVNFYGQSDATAGYATGSAGVSVGGTIATGAGGITMRGRGLSGSTGVALNGAAVTTSSGAVNITGLGGLGGTGVQVGTSQVTTTGTGAIDIRGRSGADSSQFGAGMLVSGSTVRTGGAGTIALSGEAFGSSGLALLNGTAIGGAATSGNIVLRARNTSTARTLDATGPIQTSGVLNIRPGGVSATGALTEATGTVINIGSSATAGEFSMVQDLFESGIAAGTPNVVVGSAAHTGAINVLATAPLGGSYDLTLQNDGAASGGINLYNGLSIPGRMLTLSTGGSVTQGAAIVAGRLMLHGTQPQSNFQLMDTGNAVGRVSSRFEVPKSTALAAHGDVNFYSGGNLEIGPLTGVGFDGSTGLAQSFAAANAVIAGDIVAQAGGNLTLQQNVSTLGSDITLVTGGVLLNPVNATLTPGGGGRWRVFADTWVGEVDGGLTGTAPNPNYYNCLYGAACMTALPAANNYFVYRQQPVLNLTLVTPTQSRVYGTANPAYPFTASGLVNGDTLAASAVGAYTVPAAVNVGSYAVTGAFTSPVGYLVNVAPGTLNVTPATLTYVATPASRDAGQPNPPFSGSVTGLVNGDTLAGAATGTLAFTSSAPAVTPAGQYAINGSGLTAQNYVFQQAPGNLTALTVNPLLLLAMPSIGNEVSMPSSDLYGANFGVQRACVGSGPLAGAAGAGDANDRLAMEWSRVRETPNLSNCIGLAQRYSCGDF